MGKSRDIVEQMLLGPRVRQNHALEHATISLITQRNPRSVLRGRSTANGFYVYGDLQMEDLRECAAEALQRLRNGEPEMAIHPRCGTNLAVAGMMAGLSSVLVGEIPPRRNRYSRAVLASLVSLFFAPPVGMYVQKRWTTQTPTDDMTIVDISQRGVLGNKSYFVRTMFG
ncbi:MAG: hypothetical protein JWO59_1109 [Chloroflexi bacterium]|jgi:hypothetical protein|nr:hypothetical protein [Chloroflexota bacterium]MDB5074119.1 hypothetical protein [Chloroflexota bacterium]